MVLSRLKVGLLGVVAIGAVPGLSLLTAAANGSAPVSPGATVVFDFEEGDLQGWQIVEGRLDKFVSDRDTEHHTARAFNKRGDYFLTTLDDVKPDGRQVGVAESPAFRLDGPDMSFWIAGGRHANTYVALCTIDGREALRAHGVNAQPLRRVSWSAPELVGKTVFLRLADGHRGSWGYIAMDCFEARGTLQPEATGKRRRERSPLLQTLVAMTDSGRTQIRPPSPGSPATLRAAIKDLMVTFPDRYPKGATFLKRLDDVERRAAEGSAAERQKVAEEFSALHREALLANPLVNQQPVLFIVRPQYEYNHHNTETLFQTDEFCTQQFRGHGALKTIDLASDSRVQTLLELPDGIVRDPDVSFDGSQILFAVRRDIQDDYSLYQIDADGKNLRRLTGMPGVSDIDPIYLPDGGIAFSSTRDLKYCMCNRHIMCNLFRAESDGANIHQISNNTLFDGHGSLLADGRILYSRWEYVDREQLSAQGLWSIAADGTNPATVYGNNTYSPGAVLDGRAIPGTQRIICTLAACHDHPWGALAVIDPQLGVDGRKAVIRTWPVDAIDLVDRGNQDTMWNVQPRYEDPFPLSDRYFLASRQMEPQAGSPRDMKNREMGIYLLDTFGNEVLIHFEPPGCFDPMPVKSRPRPPSMARRSDPSKNCGFFYVQDVYQGTHMENVQRGTVKYLRVIQSPDKRHWTQHGWWSVAAPAVNWHDFNHKAILGTVPVRPDGSAYFAVPAGRFVYFQLLDENKMMIHSMRSGTFVQGGETTGCVGCHEHRGSAPPVFGRESPLATHDEPSELDGWFGPPRHYSYAEELQPVLDRYCVSCHDYADTEATAPILSADRTLTFNASYEELWGRYWKSGFLGVHGAGPPPIQHAYSWGSHTSELVRLLRRGHHDVELDRESWERLVTWIDLNGPYYPGHASAYPNNWTGRSPLTDAQLKRLCELTSLKPRDTWRAPYLGPQLSFTRPEKSPVLSGLDRGSPETREALAILHAGKELLAKKPRLDMPGFLPCEEHESRNRRRACLEAIEADARKAVQTQAKVYDPQVR